MQGTLIADRCARMESTFEGRPEDGADTADTALQVVGIGASAGGLDALERFFDHLPPTTGMAFLVVQQRHAEAIASP